MKDLKGLALVILALLLVYIVVDQNIKFSQIAEAAIAFAEGLFK